MLYKFTIHLLILLFLASPALAESIYTPSHKPLKPRVEANWRASNDRSILMTEFWVPVAQNEIDGSVVYGDLRLMGDNASNREFNIGAGYRKMVETTLLGEGIAGAHVWYDRRFTKRGSKFNQVTAGMEWFGDVWDAKLNGYLPLNDSKNHTQANGAGSGARFAGNQIIVNTDQSVVEEALPGLDFELGWKVPFLDDFTDSTRIYAGAYHFEGDRADDVTGWRARIASDITSDVQLGARFQRDDERGSQAFVEATIRFPFGNKQSYKRKGLRARLDESPERDIDIVSNEAITDQGTDQTLLNAATGDIQNVIHVDNTAAGGGDGSIGTPFNTLAAAEGAATTNDLIYLHRGDGTTAGQNVGITLDDEGQMLIGSGANLIYDAGRFSTSNGMGLAGNVLVPADPLGAPVITNGAGTGVAVTADNTVVSGITVDGALQHGISIQNGSGTAWGKGINIKNVTLQNNGIHGLVSFSFNAGSSSILTISDSVANNNTTGFLLTVSINGSLQRAAFTNNVADNNITGYLLAAASGGTIAQSLFSNNLSQNSAFNGFGVQTSDLGSAINVDFSNNISRTNGRHGFYSYAFNGGTIGQADFISNTAQNNTQSGFYTLTLNGATTGQADFTGNTAQNNISYGFYAQADGSTLTNANFINNISDNNRHGFFAYALGGGTIGQADFTDNIAQNNVFNGFLAQVDGAGSTITNTDFTNNIADNNNSIGFLAQASGDGTITQATYENNLATGNTANGFAINDNSAAGSITADLGGGVFGSTGNNSAYGNTAQELFVDLDGAELKAENNWWGNAAGLFGAELVLQDASTVDTNPFLTSDPGL